MASLLQSIKHSGEGMLVGSRWGVMSLLMHQWLFESLYSTLAVNNTTIIKAKSSLASTRISSLRTDFAKLWKILTWQHPRRLLCCLELKQTVLWSISHSTKMINYYIIKIISNYIDERSTILWAKMPAFQMWGFVLHYCKQNSFGFWAVGRTKQDTLRCIPRHWEIEIIIFSPFFEFSETKRFID